MTLTVGQRIRLCKEVAHELVVVGHHLALEVHGLLAADEADEVARHDAALVDELVEGVLAVGAGLPEVDFAALEGQAVAVDVDALAVALHVHLLDVGGQLGQRLHHVTGAKVYYQQHTCCIEYLGL